MEESVGGGVFVKLGKISSGREAVPSVLRDRDQTRPDASTYENERVNRPNRPESPDRRTFWQAASLQAHEDANRLPYPRADLRQSRTSVASVFLTLSSDRRPRISDAVQPS